jgi:hypothetical protein
VQLARSMNSIEHLIAAELDAAGKALGTIYF